MFALLCLKENCVDVLLGNQCGVMVRMSERQIKSRLDHEAYGVMVCLSILLSLTYFRAVRIKEVGEPWTPALLGGRVK